MTRWRAFLYGMASVLDIGATTPVYTPRRFFPSLRRRDPWPDRSYAHTGLEDQIGKPCACARCEVDGQHAPACAVHEEPPRACDCGRRS